MLRYDAPHHKVMLDGKDGARVVLRMVTAAQALDPDQGADVGQALAKDADPAVRWREAEIVSDTISLVPSAEGTRWMTYPGMRLLVAPYADGPRSRGSTPRRTSVRSAAACRSPMRARPDASAQLNATYAQYGLPAEVSAGEVAFTCTADGTPMRGYDIVGSDVSASPGPQFRKLITRL